MGALSSSPFAQRAHIDIYHDALFQSSLLVIAIVVQTVIVVQRLPYVRLAALHLTNPLLALHVLHGPVDPALTWKDDAMAQFDKESERDRLYVGPIATGSASGQAFGVMRRSY
jgi:hypothetical protein